MNQRRIIFVTVCLLLMVLLAACAGDTASVETAPDFTLPDSEGNMVNLKEELAKNEQIVLVFYYSWTCQECVSQLKQIEQDYAMYEEKGAKVLAVAVQNLVRAGATAGTVKSHYPILADTDHNVSEAFGVYDTLPEDFGRSTPSVFIINQDMEITWKHINESVYEDGEEVRPTCGGKRVRSEVILENLV